MEKVTMSIKKYSLEDLHHKYLEAAKAKEEFKKINMKIAWEEVIYPKIVMAAETGDANVVFLESEIKKIDINISSEDVIKYAIQEGFNATKTNWLGGGLGDILMSSSARSNAIMIYGWVGHPPRKQNER